VADQREMSEQARVRAHTQRTSRYGQERLWRTLRSDLTACSVPRYYDETGKQHAKHFGRKVEAKAWLDEVTASVVIGTYVDPNAGRVTFTSFYEDWRERQVWVPGTRRAMDLAAGSVAFGNVPLSKIRKSHVEMWVKGMVVKDLAVGTIHTRAQNVRSVLRAAVEDRGIPRDPSVGVTLPRRRRAEASMEIPTT